MSVIPVHKVIQQSDFGIFLKEVSPSSTKQPVEYAHRDDYYIFGIVSSGNCCVSIDFKDYPLTENEIIYTQPNQVHRIADAGNVKAFLLFVDGVFIDPSEKQILSEYALSLAPFRIDHVRLSELIQILTIIGRRIKSLDNEDSKRIIQNLSRAAVGIITETLRGTIRQQAKNKRHVEITLAFKELLSREHRLDRKPSYYAELLHISSVYLNEVVKDITGISVSQYIQYERMLRAKRMLIYTSLHIREIAFHLGFEDHAYFTRLFTKTTGINPVAYRKKYLE